MPTSHHPARSSRARTPLRLTVGLVSAVLPLALLTTPSLAAPTAAVASAEDHGADGKPDTDSRFDAARHRPSAAQRRALDALGDDVVVGWSPGGTAASLADLGGALTPRSGGSPESTARRFLRDNQALFGLSAAQVAQLRVTMLDQQDGAHFLRFQQFSGSREVVGATALVSLDRAGRVLVAGGDLVPDAGSAPAPQISAEQAVAAAGASVTDARPQPGQRLGTLGSTQRFDNTLAVPDYDGAPVEADLVTVDTAEGPRSAWRVLADRASNATYTVLVDAGTGEVLARENEVSSSGPEGTVFTGDDPEAGGRSLQSWPGAWVDAGSDTTQGNNANTYQDAAGDNTGDAGDRPHDADQHFNYTWTDTWGNGTGQESDLPLSGDDRDAVVTQLHYYTNWFHDYAYGLGFDEESRNFQNDNFGNPGSGGDAVEAESDANFTGTQCDDDGTAVKCVNNANFNANGPDGTKPRMQMYVGLTTNPDGTPRYTQRANNRDTVIHEYVHGVTGRIISDGNLAGGIQSKSLGEGWSDAFATSINNDPVYGEYNSGDYTNGIRGVAYDDDSLEYGDFSGSSEHDNGRIWAMNMWETRAALIAKYGAATGKDKHERLMMLGLKNTPDTPSFHDARTGYLAADAIQNPTATAGVGDNWCRIWFVFADNELGVTAAQDPDDANSGSITTSTATPTECDPGADIAAVPDTDEGTQITFDASGSTTGGDSGDTLSYAWDMDNDAAYDDATGVSPTWTFGDNGNRTVGLQVTNSSGYTDTTSISVTILNVAPTVTIDLSDLVGMKEKETKTVSASFSDPGWLDTYTGNVDLGTSDLADVTPTVAVDTQGSAGTPDQGSATASVTYGDNGTYTVTVEITDDDAGTGSDDGNASVANLAPTVTIDESGQQTYDGSSAFVLKAGEDLTIPGTGTDEGSDDLGFTWDWDGPALNGETPTTQTSLVNPPATDPALSPTVQPRDVDVSADHAYTDACLYDMALKVVDDDSGQASDTTAVIVTGNATVSKGHGWWLNQYRPKGITFTTAQLTCYLRIVKHFSLVFSEERVANTRAQATDVLNAPAKAPAAVIFDQHALGAWLNFANGSVRLDSPVDTNGDGVADSTFAAVMLAAEEVRVSPSATPAQIKTQKNRIEAIATQSSP